MIGNRFFGWSSLSFLSGNSGAAGGGYAPAFQTNGPVTAMESCISILSSLIATAPRHVVAIGEEYEEPLPEHPVTALLNNPSPLMDDVQFWSGMLENTVGHGNGVAVIHRAGPALGRLPMELTPIRLENVQGVTTRGNKVIYKIRMPRGDNGGSELVEYGRGDIVHLTGDRFNGLWGQGPLELGARQAMQAANAAQKIMVNSLLNGARPQGTLEAPSDMSSKQYAELKEIWEAKYEGAGNAGKTPLLPPGAKFSPTPISNRELELINILRFQVEDISRVFRVPLTMLNRQDTAGWTANNVAQHWTNFVRSSLRPRAQRIEAQLTNKLLAGQRLDGRRLAVRLDLGPLERGTMQERIDDAIALRGGGLALPNEARGHFGWRPLSPEELAELPEPAGTPGRRGDANPPAADPAPSPEPEPDSE